jgi:hypothetical protein
MKPTIGEILGGICVVVLPFLLIWLLAGWGVGQ